MPGEEKKVEITLTARDFAYITEEGDCLVRPGSYAIAVGGQQPDEQSEKLTGQSVTTIIVQKTGACMPVEY